MQRISVVGCSGSGKTTVSRALAEKLVMPHIELDSLFHQPGWTPRPTAELRAVVSGRLAEERWIVDGNYGSHVRDLVWDRADTVVWLDMSRPRVMASVIWRTLKRGAFREELWNGNRESLRSLLNRDPRENIVLWSWTQWPKYRTQYERASADPAHDHLTFVRLRTRKEVRRWIDGLRPGRPA